MLQVVFDMLFLELKDKLLFSLGSFTLFASRESVMKTVSGNDNLLELCNQTDVFSGSAAKIEKSGLSLAVFNIDEVFYVTDDACTHGPGSLSEGCVDGEVVVCDFHQGAFNVRTGEVVAAPCILPLRTYAVHPRDGKIFIDPGSSAPTQKHICPRIGEA